MNVTKHSFEKANLTRAYIFEGEVHGPPDLEHYTVNVWCHRSLLYFRNLPIMAPYLHHVNGEGIFAAPEDGARCVVCKPSDSDVLGAFVLGFLMTGENAGADGGDKGTIDYTGRRINILPGDIVLVGRSESGLIIHRGGTVEVFASPVCKRVYSSHQDTIRDLSMQYKMDTAGGSLYWTHDYLDPNADEATLSKLPTGLMLDVKRVIGGNPVVHMELGKIKTDVRRHVNEEGVPAIPGEIIAKIVLAGREIYVDEFGNTLDHCRGNHISIVEQDRIEITYGRRRHFNFGARSEKTIDGEERSVSYEEFNTGDRVVIVQGSDDTKVGECQSVACNSQELIVQDSAGTYVGGDFRLESGAALSLITRGHMLQYAAHITQTPLPTSDSTSPEMADITYTIDDYDPPQFSYPIGGAHG